MKNALLLTVAVAAATPTSSLTAYAQLPAQQPQAAVLLTMIENLLATATMVRARQGNLGPIKEMKWSATYSGRNWTVSLEGQDGPLRITMTGFLWGDANTGWAVNYAGLGQLGDEQIRENGRTIWPRRGEPSAAPYEFQHVIEFGSHSLWGWMIGAEIVVGGTAGAVAGAETPVTAVFGAVTGAASMIGVSDVVVSHFVNAPEPPAAPAPPARPAPPQAGTMLVANAGRSYIVVQEGTIKAAGPRQQDNDFYAARGSYNGTSAQGELYLSQ